MVNMIFLINVIKKIVCGIVFLGLGVFFDNIVIVLNFK